MPTSWVKKAPILSDMQRIDLTNAKTMKKVKLFCKKKNLIAPSGFIRKSSFHYGKYIDKKPVSVLSLSAMNLNSSPGYDVKVLVVFDRFVVGPDASLLHG